VPFLSFGASRAGLFCDLSAGEFCPLRHSPPSVELRFPPLISREKTAPSRRSLQKRHQWPLITEQALFAVRISCYETIETLLNVTDELQIKIWFVLFA
jgi:hypothetical protein